MSEESREREEPVSNIFSMFLQVHRILPMVVSVSLMAFTAIAQVSPDTSVTDTSFIQQDTLTGDTPSDIDSDSARLHMQMDEIFESAKRSFANLKGTKKETRDGISIYESKLEVLGSSDNRIEMDSERSHSFISLFTGLSVEEARDKEEQLVSIIMKRVQPEGFKRGRGSDFNYYQYRMSTIEYDTDNIDELGKRPSFTIGIVKEDDGTYTTVFTAIDPLWK